MKDHYIKYPIAYCNKLKSLVNAKDFESGDKFDFICLECREELYVVSRIENIQKPHFRHKTGSTCKANFESYIHKITKHIFKTLKNVTLPPINSRLLKDSIHYNSDFVDIEINRLYAKHNVPEELQLSYKHKYVIKESFKIDIDECLIEKQFTTEIGIFQPDVTIKFQGKTIFIEPFYTHEIEGATLNKMIKYNNSVISINLLVFVRSANFYFTIEQLTAFVQNSIAEKKWEYLNKKVIDSITKKYLKLHEQKIIKNIPVINELKELNKKLELEETLRNKEAREIETHNQVIEKHRQKIIEIINRRNIVEKEVKKIKTEYYS